MRAPPMALGPPLYWSAARSVSSARVGNPLAAKTSPTSWSDVKPVQEPVWFFQKPGVQPSPTSSFWQSALQPSPSTLLPSSHSSPESRLPSPHFSTRQSELQLSPSSLLLSSHYSLLWMLQC